MGKVFVFDHSYCNGCYGCQIACKDEHCGNDWMPYQKPQPELGHFWCKLHETTHGQVPKVRIEYKPVMCQQCDACPVVAKHPGVAVKRDDGLVLLDPVKSEGMREIVDECPYGAIYWNDELNIPQKCDGCAHLVDAGEIPHCVDLCATDALKFGEEEDFADEIAKAEVLHPEYGTKPRVYYLNAPKLFIAGSVWDEKDNEVIIGAKISLEGPNGLSVETVSDDLGDFWFLKLDAGDYKVTMNAEGYAEKTVDVKLDKSLNIGDFALDRK